MSRLIINSEYRFFRTPDGAVWTDTAFPYPYWAKYLEEFSEVKILARVRGVEVAATDFKRVDGPGIDVVSMTYYVGPRQFLMKYARIAHEMKAIVRDDDAVIMISPSPLTLILERVTAAKKINYGVEVLGDPREVFSSFGIQHPLRVLFRWWLTRSQRHVVARAHAVLYVTQKSLQRVYPAGAHSFSIGVSNIDLDASHLATRLPATLDHQGRTLKIVSVGSLEQMYKGADVLLKALAILKNDGFNVHLTWVGGGRFIDELRLLARSLGLAHMTSFLGQLSSGDAVRAELDKSDLFILPSRTEGLPRALVEAMARGLPCLGSDVGGIPELLEPDELFQSENAAAAARLIQAFISHPRRAVEMSTRNMQKSHDYLNECLDKKRRAFFSAVRQAARAPEPPPHRP